MRWWTVSVLLVLAACTRGEQIGSPSTPIPSPELTPSVGAPAAAETPGAAVTPSADESPAEPTDDESKTLGTEFQIDASASEHTGYVPKTIAFQAGAANGTQPYTFLWTFDDGTIPVTGDYMIHTFTKTGRVDVFLTGRDATGATARIEIVLFLLTPDEWAQRHGVDPGTLPSETPWTSATPDVTPLPPEFLAPFAMPTS